MDFYELPNGEMQGFDDPSQVPEGATKSTQEQFAKRAMTPVLTLEQAQADQISTLQQECAEAIVSGFASSALGSVYQYPSSLTDQQNQNTVANCASGGLLWCSNGSTWELTDHTQPQAQAVIASFAAWLNACQGQLATLTQQVSAQTTAIAALAIAWTNPAQS
jgi:hypothetical protein